ncbi:WG repeat-containing protein [uncultured Clostridium sp.]|uniref:WG repeat-containing protein n=1 Tax=uncultured Clostridium sp. TaxID=59620 RepID=UPI0026037D52|nr:WG repeat-containing protein [uncultured Clostridium sp.]
MKLNLKKINYKEFLLPIVAILICVAIVAIGAPKKHEVKITFLTPLVFQNKENGLYGVVDVNRKVIVAAKYKTLLSKEENGKYFFIGITQSGTTDILNSEGAVLDHVPGSFQQVSVLSLQDKLLKVTNSASGLIGVINFENKIIIPTNYNSLTIKNNFLVLNPLSNESIANIDGKILVSSKDYASVSIQDNGIVVTNRKGLYGLLDFNGSVALPIQYTNIYGVNNNVFAVSNNDNLYALYNIQKKNMVTDFSYTSIQKNASNAPFLACKSINGVSLYGYIDSRGSTIVPFQYKSAYPFTGNYAMIQKNGVYGLIDKNGNYFINPKYNIIPGNAYAIESFQNGNYYVGYLNNSSDILNSTGKVIATVPGIVQTISNETVFYENTENKDFLYNLGTKKTTDVKSYLQPLSKGTITPAGYFGSYKNVGDSKFPNSLYLYEEDKGIITINGYNNIKFENGLFLCHSQTRYDVVEPNGKVLISFNPVDILNISITPDKIIYVQKLKPGVNRMKATVSTQEDSRLISAYNFDGKEINLSELKKA